MPAERTESWDAVTTSRTLPPLAWRLVGSELHEEAGWAALASSVHEASFHGGAIPPHVQIHAVGFLTTNVSTDLATTSDSGDRRFTINPWTLYVPFDATSASSADVRRDDGRFTAHVAREVVLDTESTPLTSNVIDDAPAPATNPHDQRQRPIPFAREDARPATSPRTACVTQLRNVTSTSTVPGPTGTVGVLLASQREADTVRDGVTKAPQERILEKRDGCVHLILDGVVTPRAATGAVSPHATSAARHPLHTCSIHTPRETAAEGEPMLGFRA